MDMRQAFWVRFRQMLQFQSSGFIGFGRAEKFVTMVYVNEIINILGIIHRPNFCLKQCWGGLTLTPKLSFK
jgi:hypothetical protein